MAKSVKRGPLSKAEKFYIENNPDNMTAEQLAKELNRSLTQVRKHFSEDVKQPEQLSKEELATQVRKPGYVDKLIGRHKRNGVSIATVMTPAASSAIDTARSGKKLPQSLKDSIHRPKG